MPLRKPLRSVRTITTICLDVALLNSTRRMNNTIKLRKLATKPPTLKALPRPAAGINGINGCSQPQPDQMKYTFSELVFSDRRRTLTEQDAREEAEYNADIEQLKNLQSNRESIQNSINTRCDTLAITLKYLERSGLTLEDVEKLSVIHVAGTKGKGSTCALTESILRQYGARTGFYSSPHLVSTNERIRINGEPLAKAKFTHFFRLVYDRLLYGREHDRDMPAFFMFLTIVGFHVFIAERVDVVVLEVGIGGELDCTNILRNVRTAGITSLSLEHTQVLGNTIKEIAWQKAGIIKPGAHVYTHVTQPECLQVIRERAAEKHAQLFEVPQAEELFALNQRSDYLNSCNDYVRLNGCLAIALAYDWLRQSTGRLHRDYPLNWLQLTDEVLHGINQANWPGRCQLVNYENMRIHLDGAHTVESIRVCCNWYQKSTKSSRNPSILVFNRTGDTDTKALLQVLQQSCRFDMVCFVPNLSSAKANDPNQTSVCYSDEAQRERASLIAATWQKLCDANKQVNRGRMYNTVWDAFVEMRTRYPAHIELDVLITGSIHLLGAAILMLDDFHSESKATNGST
ncbi:PREDICTED: folylpolyglutamate synthase, mitochondrial [Drosophila arizonae]|uniref:Folylpolyglutamate synthase n=1 Tax=Drosophila arizonae TaxID=7263 RepID=A0ABM1PSF7_DROAR|nr:PREDICTED: folylpolyglutamate synthase, mitochondrial [Drosophila arizonae]